MMPADCEVGSRYSFAGTLRCPRCPSLIEPQSGIDVDIWACKIAWPFDHFWHEKLSVVTFWFETAFVPLPWRLWFFLALTRTV